jgi:ribulose kinase
MATTEICALGAAIDTAVATGMFNNFDDAVASMTRMGKRFIPDPKNVKNYKRLFEEVYVKMDRNMAPPNRKIPEITGYPAQD